MSHAIWAVRGIAGACFFGGFILLFVLLIQEGGLWKHKQITALGRILGAPKGSRKRRLGTAAIVLLVGGGLATCGTFMVEDRARKQECADRCRAAGHEDSFFGPSDQVEKRAACWCGRRDDGDAVELYLK